MAGGSRFPYKCHSCGDKGHKASQCGKEKGKGNAKHSVYGVDEGGAEDAGADAAQDMTDLDLCVVEKVHTACTEQIGAGTPDDLPPWLVELDKFDPWAGYNPLEEQLSRDCGDSLPPASTQTQHAGTAAPRTTFTQHAHTATPRTTRTQHSTYSARTGTTQSMKELPEQVQSFVSTVSAGNRVSTRQTGARPGSPETPQDAAPQTDSRRNPQVPIDFSGEPDNQHLSSPARGGAASAGRIAFGGTEADKRGARLTGRGADHEADRLGEASRQEEMQRSEA